MSILTVEDALLAEVRAALGNKVRKVESLPSDWDDATLTTLLRDVPGAFVAFGGGAVNGRSQVEPTLDSRWVVYVATGHASGEAARRRGDALQAGAYELLTVLVPRLHGLRIAGAGSAQVSDVANLWTGAIDKRGAAVYAITLALPMPFSLDVAPDLLAPFATFDARYDIPPHTTAVEHRKWLDGTPTTTAPDARDTVALPQP